LEFITKKPAAMRAFLHSASFLRYIKIMNFRKLRSAFAGFATGAALPVPFTIGMPLELKLLFSGVVGVAGAYIGIKADKEPDKPVKKSSFSRMRRAHTHNDIDHLHHNHAA
jgi:hypothetical protein